jgi:hypothetical protein
MIPVLLPRIPLTALDVSPYATRRPIIMFKDLWPDPVHYDRWKASLSEKWPKRMRRAATERKGEIRKER